MFETKLTINQLLLVFHLLLLYRVLQVLLHKALASLADMDKHPAAKNHLHCPRSLMMLSVNKVSLLKAHSKAIPTPHNPTRNLNNHQLGPPLPPQANSPHTMATLVSNSDRPITTTINNNTAASKVSNKKALPRNSEPSVDTVLSPMDRHSHNLLLNKLHLVMLLLVRVRTVVITLLTRSLRASSKLVKVLCPNNLAIHNNHKLVDTHMVIHTILALTMLHM